MRPYCDAPSEAPRLSIIIPHYNDVTRLSLCLTSLVPQCAGAPVEVIVVDNGSTEDLSEIKTAFPAVQFLEEAKKGAAPARNTGVAQSVAPGLLFIDADCVPAEDWVVTALDLAGGDEIIGGEVSVFDETPPPRSGAEAFETVFAFRQDLYISHKNFSVTANLLTSRVVFDDTGPFDGTVVEDSDWCQRAVARGWPISYHPEMRVAHPTRNDWAALHRKWKRITAENYFAGGESPVARLKWALRAIMVLVSIPAHVPKVLSHPDLLWVERLRALGTLVSLRVCRSGWMLRQALFGERPLNT